MKLPRRIHRIYQRLTDPAQLLHRPGAADPLGAVPAATAGNEWDELSAQIIAEVKAHPRSFLRQPMTARCLHPNQQRLSAKLLAVMAADRDFMDAVVLKATEPSFGNPFSMFEFPRLSPGAVAHLYYLYLARKRLGLDLLTDVQDITEVGGGYGGLCRLMRGLGYSGGYTIVDLPQMLAVQRHYLDHTGGAASLVPAAAYQPTEALRPSVMFATFSLSEMPPEAQERVERWMPHFDYLLLAYNRGFAGIDNISYFAGLDGRLKTAFSVLHFTDAVWGCHFLLAQRLAAHRGAKP